MHHIAFPLPVVALLPAKVRHTAYAIVSATFLDAAVRVLNKRSLEQPMRVVEIKMMYDTVPEHSSEYLSLLGVVHNEAFRRQGLVSARIQIVAQLFHVLLEIALPFLDIVPGRLVLLRTVECLIEVEK
jgi:hypothetical protein